jgi:Phycobilisome degradation protein nblA
MVQDSLVHTQANLIKVGRAMDHPVQLSLEQQFSLKSFESQVSRMSHQQAQDFLVKLYEQMMLRETLYKHFLKDHWGIATPPLNPEA